MPYEAFDQISICYMDNDGSNHYNNEDSVILMFRSSCSAESGSNDVRLAEWFGHPAGERLRTSVDQGSSVEGLSPEPRFWFFDQNADGRLNPGETVYLRLHKADQDRVRTDDVRITAFGNHDAGSRVAPGDADQSRSLHELGTASERIRHTDVLDTNSFTSHDAIWLSADITREAAGRGDIRIYSPEPSLAFGEPLITGEPEPQDTVRTIRRYLCMTDETATGAYAPGDPLYLSLGTQCTGNVQSGDLRLSNNTHGETGSHVQQGDNDLGERYIVLPDARVGYVDNDGDSRLSRGDLAVIRIVSPTDNGLRPGDLLLSPTNRGAGVVLNEGDPMIGTAIRDIGRFEDLLVYTPSSAGASLHEGDPVYLSPDTSTGDGLTPEAVRLTIAGGLPFGGPAGLETGELLSSVTRTTTSICTTKVIGEDYNFGDPVYLRFGGTCPSQVTKGLFRLVPVNDHEAFTAVQTGDNDTGRTLFTPGNEPRLRYYGIGEATWGYTARLYLNLIDPEDDDINPGDIRLAYVGEGQEAGRAVAPSDSDRTISGLQELGFVTDHAAYIDMDQDNSFGTRDKVYIIPSLEHEYVTPLSMRLAALPEPSTPLSVPEPIDNSGDPEVPDDDGTDPPPTPDPGDDDTVGDGSQADGDDEEEPTPAPAAAILALLLMGLLAVRRRRHR